MWWKNSHVKFFVMCKSTPFLLHRLPTKWSRRTEAHSSSNEFSYIHCRSGLHCLFYLWAPAQSLWTNIVLPKTWTARDRERERERGREREHFTKCIANALCTRCRSAVIRELKVCKSVGELATEYRAILERSGLQNEFMFRIQLTRN